MTRDKKVEETRSRESFFEKMKESTHFLPSKEFQELCQSIQTNLKLNINRIPAFFIAQDKFKRLFPQKKYAGGNFLVFVQKDIFPSEDFKRYVIEHEYWEIYINTKNGFNLFKNTDKDKYQPPQEQERFAHKFSTYKEFLMAEREGRLDEYIKWWEDIYDAELCDKRNQGKELDVKFIEKAMAIKQEVYKKISSKRVKRNDNPS